MQATLAEQKNLITVILIADSVDQALRNAISSLENQTTPGEYLLAVDAANADAAESLLRKNNLLSTVRIFAHTHGLSYAVDAAAQSARGALVSFLRSNDLFAPTYLETVQKYFTEFNCEMVACDVKSFNEARNLIPAPDGIVDILSKPWLPLALTIRRDRLVDVKFASAAPSIGLARVALFLLQQNCMFRVLRSPLYFHRSEIHDDQLLSSANLGEFMEMHAEAYRENWKEVLLAKDQVIYQLSGDLAPKYERLKQEHEKLEARFNELNEKYEELEAHHARSLSSIKVTGVHLLRAIFSRFSTGKG